MRYFLSTIFILASIVGANAQRVLSLKECLETGLQNNYDLLIVRNEQQMAANNATAANAGMLPSLDLSAGYSGAAKQTHTTPRTGESYTTDAAYDQVIDLGVSLGWTTTPPLNAVLPSRLAETKGHGAHTNCAPVISKGPIGLCV